MAVIADFTYIVVKNEPHDILIQVNGTNITTADLADNLPASLIQKGVTTVVTTGCSHIYVYESNGQWADWKQ